MERKTNWIAIVVAVVAAMVVGFLWYGPVFGASWMASNGFTMDEAAHKVYKNGVELPMSMTPMYFNIAAMIVFALLMNWLTGRAGATTWAEGAKVGAAVGPLVQLTLMGAIVGGWRKK